MILSDREVQLAIRRGLFTITDAPGVEFYNSTTVDLRLDAELSIWGKIEGDESVAFDRAFDPQLKASTSQK